MSDLWIPVIAALGASFLTVVGTFGLEWWRSHRAVKLAQDDQRIRAYSRLLARSAVIMYTASALHSTMEVRSGLKDGLDVVLHHRKPLDPLELMDRLRSDIEPIYDACSEIWTIGSKEAIAAANDIVVRTGIVMGTATQRGEAVPPFLRNLIGEKWTQEQLDKWEEELRGLAKARKLLGEIARKEAGVKHANLFASNDLNSETAPPGLPSTGASQALVPDARRP